MSDHRHNRNSGYRTAGRRLRVVRQHLGYSPAMLASKLGLTERAYLAYERGQRTRGWNKLIYPIIDATGVSLDWLFDRDESGRNDNRPIFSSPTRGLYTRPPRLHVIAGGAA